MSGAAVTVAACAPLVIAATLAFAPADLERYGYPALLAVGVAGLAHLARHHIAQALACVLVAGLVGAVSAFAFGSAPVLF